MQPELSLLLSLSCKHRGGGPSELSLESEWLSTPAVARKRMTVTRESPTVPWRKECPDPAMSAREYAVFLSHP